MHINEDITLEQVELAEATLERVKAEAAKGEDSAWDQRFWATSVPRGVDDFWSSDERFKYEWVDSGAEVPVTNLVEDANICGTSGCFAGWACSIAGKLVVGDGTAGASVYEIVGRTYRGRKIAPENVVAVSIGARIGAVESVAADLLGIQATFGADNHLFSEYNDLPKLAEYVKEMRDCYETRIAHEAELAAEQRRLDSTLEA